MENHNDYRVELLKQLELLFGTYKESQNRISFLHYSYEEIGLGLGINKSQLSRMLKSPELKEKQPPGEEAYGKLIERLKILNRNRHHLSGSVSQTDPSQDQLGSNSLKKTSLGLLLLIGAIGIALGAFIGWSLSKKPVPDFESSVVSAPLIPLAITSSDQAQLVMARNSELITQRLIDAAYAENRELTGMIGLEGILTKDQLIETAQSAITTIENIMIERRRDLREVNYRIAGQMNLVDLIDHYYPLEDLFICSAETIALSPILPDSASLYDHALKQMLALITRPGTDYEHFKREIRNSSINTQNRIRERYMPDIDCYVRTGGRCDENKPNLPDPSDYRLVMNLTQQRNIFDLYSKYIKYHIALEGLKFNSSVKEGLYDDDPDFHIGALKNDCINVIVQARKMIYRTSLHTPNGVALSDLFEEKADNQLDRSIRELLPILTSKTVSVDKLSEAILAKIDLIQANNEKAFEDMLKN